MNLAGVNYYTAITCLCDRLLLTRIFIEEFCMCVCIVILLFARLPSCFCLVSQMLSSIIFLWILFTLCISGDMFPLYCKMRVWVIDLVNMVCVVLKVLYLGLICQNILYQQNKHYFVLFALLNILVIYAFYISFFSKGLTLVFVFTDCSCDCFSLVLLTVNTVVWGTS